MGTLTAYTRLVANEPSVGMYFVQEHVRKSVPFVVSAKVRGGSVPLQDCGVQCVHTPFTPGSPARRGQADAIVQVREGQNICAEGAVCAKLEKSPPAPSDSCVWPRTTGWMWTPAYRRWA